MVVNGFLVLLLVGSSVALGDPDNGITNWSHERSSTFKCPDQGTFCMNCQNVSLCIGAEADPLVLSCGEKEVCLETGPSQAACVNYKESDAGLCDCERIDSNYGYIQDPYDPSKWIVCYNTHDDQDFKTCPQGTIFSVEDGNCMEINSTPIPTTPSPTHRDGPINFACHGSGTGCIDCLTAIFCTGPRADPIILPCDENHVCIQNAHNQASCGEYEGVTAGWCDCDRIGNDGFMVDIFDYTKYVICTPPENQYYGSCPEGKVASQEHGRCICPYGQIESQGHGRCVKINTTPKAITSSSTTLIPTVSSPIGFECPDQGTHCADCITAVVCTKAGANPIRVEHCGENQVCSQEGPTEASCLNYKDSDAGWCDCDNREGFMWDPYDRTKYINCTPPDNQDFITCPEGQIASQGHGGCTLDIITTYTSSITPSPTTPSSTNPSPNECDCERDCITTSVVPPTADPTCQSFVLSFDTKLPPYTLSCPTGQAFDISKLECVPVCELAPPPFSCPEDACGTFPDTVDCTIYHVCIDGQITVSLSGTPCEEGHVFDPKSMMCVHRASNPDVVCPEVNPCWLAHCEDCGGRCPTPLY